MKYVVSPPGTLANGHTRTVVTFSPSDGAPVVEDFITNVQPVGSRVVTDKGGRFRTTSGEWVTAEQVQQRVEAITTWKGRGDPPPMYEFEREEYEVDVVAVLTENIERYLHRRREDGTCNAERIEAGLLQGNRTSPELAKQVRKTPEPWLRTAAVLAIAGKDVEVPVDRARIEALRAERGR